MVNNIESTAEVKPFPVFISYKKQDQTIADNIYDALVNRGISCWISSRDVKPGTNYQEQITQAIRNCSVMVLVFSRAAQQSPEIPRELSLASQNKKPVIPVRIDAVEPDDVFAYTLATSQFLDAHDNWVANSAKYIGQIAKAVSYHRRSLSDQVAPSSDVSSEIVSNQSPLKLLQEASAEQAGGYSANTRTEDSKAEATKAERIPASPHFLKAVAAGRQVRNSGGKKMAAARTIFSLIGGEPRALVIDALIQGADCTPNGASTYYKNLKAGKRLADEEAEETEYTDTRASTKSERSAKADSSLPSVPSVPSAATGKSFSVAKVILIAGLGIAFAYYFDIIGGAADKGPAVATKSGQSQQVEASAEAGKPTAKTNPKITPMELLAQYPLESAKPIIWVMLRAARDGHEAVLLQAAEQFAKLPQLARGDRAAARAANARGLELFKTKDYAPALSLFLDAVGSDNGDEEAVNNVSYAFFMSGSYAEAKQWAEVALTLNVNGASAWFNLAMAYAELDTEEVAVGAFLLSHKHSKSLEKSVQFLTNLSIQDSTSQKAKESIKKALVLLAAPKF